MIDLIKKQPTTVGVTREWIPVTERLPEEHSSRVYKSESDIVEATITDLKYIKRAVVKAKIIDDEWDIDPFHRVLAWRPIIFGAAYNGD